MVLNGYYSRSLKHGVRNNSVQVEDCFTKIDLALFGQENTLHLDAGNLAFSHTSLAISSY